LVNISRKGGRVLALRLLDIAAKKMIKIKHAAKLAGVHLNK